MKPSEKTLDYLAIFEALNKLKIDYLVVGGLAANFHGIPRMTYDIDLMIRLESPNILKLVKKLSQWGYQPKVPVNPTDLADDAKRNLWIDTKGMKAFNFYSETLPIGEIDLIIASPIPYPQLKKRSVPIEIKKKKIPVISIPDLIALKVKAGREQDIADVKYLKMIQEK